MVGVKAGDEKVINVPPGRLSAANLAGKDATFDIKVKAVAAAEPLEVNDELASKLGIESVDRLKEIVRGQLESQFGTVTRQKLKRQLLDQMDALYDLETPAASSTPNSSRSGARSPPISLSPARLRRRKTRRKKRLAKNIASWPNAASSWVSFSL